MRQLKLQSFSLPDTFIKDNLSVSEFERLKAKFKSPFLKAWVAIQEGISNPFSITEGRSIDIHWNKDVVQKAPLKTGIKFFEGHAKDNSTKNRIEQGEIAKIIDLEIDGKATKAIIGAFPESKKSLVQAKDIISMEFDADLDEDDSPAPVAEFIGRAIESISAIALGESKTDTPGFPGVRALSELQAFNQNISEEKPKGKTQMPTIEEIMAGLNTDIVRSWITKNKDVYVGMVFPEDRYMPDFIEDENAKGTGRGHYKNGEKSIRKLLNDHQERVNKTLSEIDTERKENALKLERTTAAASVLESIKGKKIPEGVRKEIESRIQELDIEAYKKDKAKAISQFVDLVLDSELKVIARHQGDDQAKKLREEWLKEGAPTKAKPTTDKLPEPERPYIEEPTDEDDPDALSLPGDDD
ncbi:hypothetical protein LEP1GSC165_0031 [Leptospira santarosai str. CBC523]|uniref:hypothetical protein n=1 Tax=Leptospira santarosai TaxID=28183 RepID=UPI0002BDDC48|nr:hypothetical protein [Leptospira santarosai]EMO12466.1 hypothetical protein LEP1GSC165_0031 [Leptospira santarosai str. CBC523]